MRLPGFYPRSIVRTLAASASDTMPALRSLRFRPEAFLVRMCRFTEWPRFTLRVSVSLNRFLAARLVLSFSFAFGFLIYSLLSPAAAAGGSSVFLAGRGAFVAGFALAALAFLAAFSSFSLALAR